MTRHPRSAGAAGFTLLELMVVILVFGIFAAMAYGGLNTVLNTRNRVESALARTAEYQRAYLRLRTDFANASSRTILNGDGDVQPAFGYDSYYKRIEFTRGGWSNPTLLPRATIERVGYFLDDTKGDDKKLVRRSWRVLDRAPQTQPIDETILDPVDSVKWRFLDSNQQLSDSWPPSGTGTGQGFGSTSNQNAPIPAGIELTMTTPDWGEFRLVFRFGPEGISGTQPGSTTTPATGTTPASATTTGTAAQ
jgi:general secretion pathway protein J